MQEKPLSILQIEEQPSPFIALPSSHYYFDTTMKPSPHIGLQIEEEFILLTQLKYG